MGITAYSRTCAQSRPGNRSKFFLNPVSNIDDWTITDGEISALSVIEVETEAQNFTPILTKIDAVQFTSEGEGSSVYNEENSLIFMFRNPDKELRELHKELIEAVPCGIAGILVDNNKKAWLIGVNELDGADRGLHRLQTSFDSGTEKTDEDGQMHTFTLSGDMSLPRIPFDETLTTAILDGTADFIDWE